MNQKSLRDEKIFIKSNYRGFIPQLRMRGPIITPVRVTRAMAYQLIIAGIDVYEIDKTTRNATRLTLQSVFPGEGDEATAREKARYTVKKAPAIKSVNLTDKAPVEPTILSGVSIQQPETPVQYKAVAEDEKVNVAKDESAEVVADSAQDAKDSAEEKTESQNPAMNHGQSASKKNKKNRNR